MLHFEGTKDFPQPPAEVWGKLTDARFLVGCVPGVESVKEATADRAVCVLRPGFSFVRGTLEVALQLADRVEPTSARLLVQGKGIGSSSEVEATMRLAPHDGGTRMAWTAEIKQLGGLLKALPKGLVKASAEKVLNDAWEVLKAKLGT
jgi:carbon monoxide dehydrogenase subunit G